ncbi:MAG: type transport system ATP-binding protein [Solirubrobacteraceae bacterium]|nr:type transport system ATP-binding protein [Solirubrobacteraceae bacterium]
MHTLKERALHPRRTRVHDGLHALRDVSFSVGRGEFFGVVGRNGSGKSTLLRAIAGIYRTDRGSIYVDGTISTFLELGVGFNLDLVARDNIVLNLTMLGCTPREARKRVDAVVEFAELGDFVDLKLKNYSSGMMVRLGFSVMINVDAEILLIDEILAVGDAAFRQKCEDEFERIRSRGATVVLVTHDLNALRRYCDRALLLEQGGLVAIGDPQEVGNRYMQMNFSQEARAAAEAMIAAAGHAMPAPFEPISDEEARLGDNAATITEAWFEDRDGAPAVMLPQGERCRFVMRVRFEDDVENPQFSMSLTNDQRQPLLSSSSEWTAPQPGHFRAGEEAIYRVAFENILGPGRYTAVAAVTQAGGRVLELRERLLSLMVTTTRPTGALVGVPQEVSVERVPQPRVSPAP